MIKSPCQNCAIGWSCMKRQRLQNAINALNGVPGIKLTGEIKCDGKLNTAQTYQVGGPRNY